MAQESLTAKILYFIIQIIENAYDKKNLFKTKICITVVIEEPIQR